jgi:hypothetical protein
MSKSLKVVSLTLRQANKLVEDLHRHHKPARGHRFSLGAVNENGKLCAAVIVGRPVARAIDWRLVVEVNRLVSDGTKNACSFLYGAAARVSREMGFEKIQTYLLEDELATTMKASGWTLVAITAGGQWTGTNNKARRTDQPTVPKQRWEKILNAEVVYD